MRFLLYTNCVECNEKIEEMPVELLLGNYFFKECMHAINTIDVREMKY